MTKYLAKNRCLLAFLYVTDFLTRFLPKRKQAKVNFKRVLLCNLAHLGDVILTTSVLPAIKKKYPDCQIDLLIGSWAKPLVDDHPFIHQVHCLDHWKLNRGQESFFKKLLYYYRQKKQLKRKLKQYDVAIDFYPFFPNVIPILWRAKIPVRIGFDSGGFGHLLTHSCCAPSAQEHIVFSFFRLLNYVGIVYPDSPAKPCLPNRSATSLLQKYCLKEKTYAVVHVGCSQKNKQWPQDRWQRVVKILADAQIPLVFTGEGKKEEQEIKRIIPNHSCLNLCSKLNLKELSMLLSEAAFLLSVDTLACHIAVSYDIPSLIIYTGINSIEMWRPVGDVKSFILPSAEEVARQTLEKWFSS